MWKKYDRPDEIPTDEVDRSQPRPAAAPAPASATSGLSYASGGSEPATIGRSITLRGDITGDEDLTIQGRVEGSVNLAQHSVTVGSDGEVIANIVGRLVTVEGRVEGNIDGGEQVILRNSALVRGDITAPRVVLEDGARFRGLVDMGAAEGDDQAVWTGVGARADAQKGTANGPTTTPPAVALVGTAEKAAAEPDKRASPVAEAKHTDPESPTASSGVATGKRRKPTEAEAQVTI